MTCLIARPESISLVNGDIAESRSGLAAMLEATPDAVVAVDDAGTIRKVNSQAEHLFGYAPGEMIGLPLECLVPEDVRVRHAGYREGFQACPHLRRMGDADRQLAALRKDGTLVPVDIGLGTLQGHEGRLTLAFVRDQSRTRALLDALSRAREQLELELELRRNYRSLSELLQSSAPQEAMRPVLSMHLEHLFPETSGAILLLDEHRNRVDCLVGWGATDHWSSFVPRHCAALQSGAADSGDGGPESSNRPCVDCLGHGLVRRCAPLRANGETIGVLAVHRTAPAVLLPSECRSVDAVAERLSLPVANRRLRERLQELTYRDPLTGLYNRRYLQDALAKALAVARRTKASLAVAVLDLDHFKALNDAWGHALGDDVLRAFAARLSARFRASDIVCRYGGEEFVVVASGCSSADLAAALDSVRVDWGCGAVATQNGVEITSTFSAGVSQYPHDGADGDTLLQCADASLYGAKRLGRNRVVGHQGLRDCLGPTDGTSHTASRD